MNLMNKLSVILFLMPIPLLERWMKDCAFKFPSTLNAAVSCPPAHARLRAPFSKRFGHSFDCYRFSFYFIQRLLRRGCPPAVLWRIITRAVNPINRVIKGRRKSHVGQKIREGIHPSCCNFNSSPTVFFPIGAIFIKTALPDIDPAVISFTPNWVRTFAIRNTAIKLQRRPLATTRGGGFRFYGWFVNFFNSSARALRQRVLPPCSSANNFPMSHLGIMPIFNRYAR